MSKLRLTRTCTDDTPCPTNGTAYLMILNAVQTQRGLIHGVLDDAHGEHCAIGSFFEVNPKLALRSDLIDEVALVNDSMPKATPRQRKIMVARWLRWKLKALGL